MADRIAEMNVSTQSSTLAVLDAKALVENLTERLAEVKENRLGNIYF